MPGVTQLSLCDETLTFHHDAQLVGFCLDDPNEPPGDDWETRLAVNLGDKWWIPLEEMSEADDVREERTTVEEHIEVSFEEPRGMRRYFAQLSRADQLEFIEEAGAYIQMLIGAFGGWTASDEFVLEYIEDELRPLALAQRARAAYEQWKREQVRDANRVIEDFDEWMPAQAGGHVKAKPAVRQEENNYEYHLWSIGRDSIDRFRVRANESNCCRKKCRQHKIRSERQEMNRLVAQAYLAAHVPANTHIDALEVEVADRVEYERAIELADMGYQELEGRIEEARLVLKDIPGWQGDGSYPSYHDWLENGVGCFDTVDDFHFGLVDSFFDRHDDCYDDMYAHAERNRGYDSDDGVESDKREYLFEDYQGPDNPHTGEDDPEDYFDHKGFAQGTRFLIPRGTPRHQLRSLG